MAGRNLTARLGLVVAAAALLASCSYIFDLPSLGQAVATDAAPADATPSVDGGLADGPIITKPPPPPFCASQTTPNLFCADMDGTSAPTLTDLGAPALTSGGQCLVVDSVSQSPPRSLLATVGGAGEEASIVHAIPTGSVTAGITASFDVLVSKWQTTSAAIGGVTLGACEVAILGTAAGWQVMQSCTVDGSVATVTTNAARPVATGAWHRFVAGLKLIAPKTVTLDIDGERVVDVAALDAFGPGTGTASASFGLDHVTDGAAIVFEDDLLVTSP